MKCLVLFALPEERVEVSFAGMDTVTECIGVGKVNAAIAAMDAVQRHRPDLVVSMGTAGTLVHEVGDVVVCSEFVDRDLEKTGLGMLCHRLTMFSAAGAVRFGLEGRVGFGGVCNTGDSFLTEAVPTEGDVFEMEAFAVACVCRRFGLPFFAVKYVTDVIGRNSVKQWAEKLSDARAGLSAFVQKHFA